MKTIRLTMTQALVRFLEKQYLAGTMRSSLYSWNFYDPGHGNVVGLGQAIAQEAKRMETIRGK